MDQSTLQAADKNIARYLRSQLGIPVLAIMTLASTGCGSEQSLPQVAKPQAEEVTVAQLLSAPTKFDAALVRVIGVCTIMVEGNALYPPSETESQQSTSLPAIWLDLKSPVPPEVRALNGKYALIEGRFDSSGKGHEGLAQGTIRDIVRFEESSREAEAEVRRRVNQSR
jgi:hypothetical protein